jgi:ATP-dependent DNA ligase
MILKYIQDIISTNNIQLRYIKLVDTLVVNNEQDIKANYDQFIKEKYEGAILRLNLTYEYSINGYHSKHLLKYKPCFDHEYTIVDWTTGSKGKAAQAILFVCEVYNQDTMKLHTFNVTPAIELEERIALSNLMNNIEPNNKTHFDNHYKGKLLKVYYNDLSIDGIPQQARSKLEIGLMR